MEFENKKLRDVADIAARIMMGEKALHPNQQKLDVHEPEKDELTAKDFEMLRNKKKMKEEADHEKSCECDDCSKEKVMTKESVQQLDEATYVVKHDGVADDHKDADAKKLFAGKKNVNSHVSKYASSAEKHADMLKAKGFKNVRVQTLNKEEVEEIEEMFPGTPEYEKKYGKAPQDMKKGEKKATTKGEMEKTEKGVVHRRKFSEMVESYSDGGIKGLFKTLAEEPTNAEFTAQLDDAKKRAAGTKKQPEVSKPAVQAVQNEETHTTVEFIDYNDVNGVKVSEIDLEERKLTAAETDKKEEIVKSMKKGLAGFKERYGDRAKEVMYATATKQAKKD